MKQDKNIPADDSNYDNMWPFNGKKWDEMTSEEKIDSIRKQMEQTQEEEGWYNDKDNGC